MNCQLNGYHLQGSHHAINIFRSCTEYPDRIVVNGLRYLFQYHRRDNGYIERFVSRDMMNERLEHLFALYVTREPSEATTYVLSELADIALQFHPPVAQAMLNQVREIGIEHPARHTRAPESKRTVYNDSQNVHNTQINNSVLDIVKHLCSNYRVEQDKYKDICPYIVSQLRAKFGVNERTEDIVKQLFDSSATFGIDTTLGDIIVSLWKWVLVQPHENRDGIFQRLHDELQDMHSVCSTGQMARLVNVMQGFTGDERLTIRISAKEQCRAVVYAYLTRSLQECTDPAIVEGMLDKTPEFRLFVHDTVLARRSVWKDEYGDEFDVHVDGMVKQFIT